MAFEARYGGECAYGDRIQPGDSCVYTDDDEIAHAECDHLEGVPPNIHADGPVCQSCFTIHRGECI